MAIQFAPLLMSLLARYKGLLFNDAKNGNYAYSLFASNTIANDDDCIKSLKCKTH